MFDDVPSDKCSRTVAKTLVVVAVSRNHVARDGR